MVFIFVGGILVLGLIVLSWMSLNGDFYWGHSYGFIGLSGRWHVGRSSESTPAESGSYRRINRSAIPLLVNELLRRDKIEWFGISSPDSDETCLGYMWVDEELRLDATFRRADPTIDPDSFDATVQKHGGRDRAVNIFNEFLGPEEESMQIEYQIEPASETLVCLTDELATEFLKVQGEEILVFVGHSADLPGRNGLVWKRKVDRLSLIFGKPD